jgi:hypothetical protein
MDKTEELEIEVVEPEDEVVFRWRLEQLEHAGYDPCSAFELAGRYDVDLHLALDLRAHGCPLETAVRILT